MDSSDVVNGVPLEYVTLHAKNYSPKEAVGWKSVTKRVYVTENYILKYSTRINCSTIVYILDASNVVNGVPLEYVTLHAVNYKLK